MNINSGMASARAMGRAKRFKKAYDNTIKELSRQPNQPVRVSTKLAKHVLLGCPTLLACGVNYSTQVRNIGAGVKELYLKAKIL